MIQFNLKTIKSQLNQVFSLDSTKSLKIKSFIFQNSYFINLNYYLKNYSIKR